MGESVLDKISGSEFHLKRLNSRITHFLILCTRRCTRKVLSIGKDCRDIKSLMVIHDYISVCSPVN